AASPVCLYAGSLVPVELLAECPEDACLVDTANLDIEQITEELVRAHAKGHDVARLHSGDPSVFSAVNEQMKRLDEADIPYEVVEEPDHPENVLLITHGLTMRLFCMRWFHWSVAEFESLSNPGNGEARTLLLGENGRYTLDLPFRRWRTPEPYGRTG
ncbi:SAM-dependent methyltransferase, partial [Streptomyces halstedii]|uniref:SAM-dependent methyltransferase n=1 Tax=Streptomyces halstedii TaxID=1944 RepID=UPI0033A1FC72